MINNKQRVLGSGYGLRRDLSLLSNIFRFRTWHPILVSGVCYPIFSRLSTHKVQGLVVRFASLQQEK